MKNNKLLSGTLKFTLPPHIKKISLEIECFGMIGNLCTHGDKGLMLSHNQLATQGGTFFNFNPETGEKLELKLSLYPDPVRVFNEDDGTVVGAHEE